MIQFGEKCNSEYLIVVSCVEVEGVSVCMYIITVANVDDTMRLQRNNSRSFGVTATCVYLPCKYSTVRCEGKYISTKIQKFHFY